MADNFQRLYDFCKTWFDKDSVAGVPVVFTENGERYLRMVDVKSDDFFLISFVKWLGEDNKMHDSYLVMQIPHGKKKFSDNFTFSSHPEEVAEHGFKSPSDMLLQQLSRATPLPSKEHFFWGWAGQGAR